MVKHTVNELLVMKVSLQKRLGECQRLQMGCMRRSVCERTVHDASDTTTTTRDVDESRYDPNDLELKCSEINFALFEIDRAIKVANASTVVEVDVEFKNLLAPVPPRPWTESE